MNIERLTICAAVDAARILQTSIPYSVRRILSSRFFSTLSDFITSAPHIHRHDADADTDTGKTHVKHTNKTEYALQLLGSIVSSCDELETQNCVRICPPKEPEDEDDSDEEEKEKVTLEQVKEQIAKLQTLSKDCLDSDDSNRNQGRTRAVTGCTALLLSLYVQLLRCGSSASDDEQGGDEDMQMQMQMQDEDEQEEEEEEEGIQELLKDLLHATNNIVTIVDRLDEQDQDDEKKKKKKKSKKAKKEEQDDDDDDDSEQQVNPLALLADVCISSLSLFDKTSKSSRSTKMLRETTKMAWTGSLIAAASSPESTSTLTLTVDEQVMELVLESVIGPAEKEGDEDMEDMEDMDEEDEDEDGSEVEDEEAFNAAMKKGLDVEDKDVDEDDSDDDDDNDDNNENDKEEKDIELDPAQLENLLLNDDSEEEENILEHHEGADAALAAMIKLKQESRKQAQEVKERLEYAHRLRNVMLLESLFSTHGATTGSSDDHDTPVFSNRNVVLGLLLPLLTTRRALEKAMAAEDSMHSSKKSGGPMTEKKVLHEKLTPLIKNKICKTKVSSPVHEHEHEHEEDKEALTNLANDILKEAKKSPSVGHCTCCSSALLFVLKCVQNKDDVVQSIYQDAVEDWSTRKATKLHTILLEDFITRFPDMARIKLTPMLVKAATQGRSVFIKSETFRLLSQLYHHINIAGSASSEDDNSVESSLESNASDCVTAIHTALQDTDFTKAKRMHHVLKAAESLGSFVSSCTLKSDAVALNENVTALCKTLTSLKESTQSEGIKKHVGKLMEVLGKCQESCKSQIMEVEVETKSEKEEETEPVISTPSSSSSKKKKKKKGKKGKK